MPQYADTVLPWVESGVVNVYCKCFDSAGRQRIKVYPVQLINSDFELSYDTSEPRLSDIIIYAENHIQTG